MINRRPTYAHCRPEKRMDRLRNARASGHIESRSSIPSSTCINRSQPPSARCISRLAEASTSCNAVAGVLPRGPIQFTGTSEFRRAWRVPAAHALLIKRACSSRTGRDDNGVRRRFMPYSSADTWLRTSRTSARDRRAERRHPFHQQDIGQRPRDVPSMREDVQTIHESRVPTAASEKNAERTVGGRGNWLLGASSHSRHLSPSCTSPFASPALRLMPLPPVTGGKKATSSPSYRRVEAGMLLVDGRQQAHRGQRRARRVPDIGHRSNARGRDAILAPGRATRAHWQNNER